VPDPPDGPRGIRAYAPLTDARKFFPDAVPKRGDEGDRVIKLMPEYSVEVPLWGPWRQLDLPGALVARLRTWQEDFDLSFRPESGWLSSTARQRWAAEAEALAVELRHEIGDRAEVTVNLWPLGDD